MKKNCFLLATVIVIAASCNSRSSDSDKSHEMNHDHLMMDSMKMDNMNMDSTIHNNHQMMDSVKK